MTISKDEIDDGNHSITECWAQNNAETICLEARSRTPEVYWQYSDSEKKAGDDSVVRRHTKRRIIFISQFSSPRIRKKKI